MDFGRIERASKQIRRIKMSGIDGRIISVNVSDVFQSDKPEETYTAFIITFEDGTQKMLVATTEEKEEFYREELEKLYLLYGGFDGNL